MKIITIVVLLFILTAFDQAFANQSLFKCEKGYVKTVVENGNHSGEYYRSTLKNSIDGSAVGYGLYDPLTNSE